MYPVTLGLPGGRGYDRGSRYAPGPRDYPGPRTNSGTLGFPGSPSIQRDPEVVFRRRFFLEVWGTNANQPHISQK